jgi:hypothetical protein
MRTESLPLYMPTFPGSYTPVLAPKGSNRLDPRLAGLATHLLLLRTLHTQSTSRFCASEQNGTGAIGKPALVTTHSAAAAYPGAVCHR